MQKIPQYILVICLFTIGINAQTRTRLVDNFDMPGGVRVNTPVATPAPAPVSAPVSGGKNNKKLVKKTAQITMSVEDAVSLRGTKSGGYQLPPLAMSAGNSLGVFSTGNITIDAYIVDSSKRYGIDPLLIYAQMHQESGFKLKATSYKGASGLMQLMPATARRFGVTDIYEPRQNIDAGIKYMRWLLNTFDGDLNLALAGYNAGEGAVMKYGRQIPPYNETRDYVKKITSRYNSIRNPNYIRTVKNATKSEVAKIEQMDKIDKKGEPATVFQRNTLTVRMPDGRLRLVN